MRHWFKPLAALLLVPLLLTGCLFTPGKFESSLTIHADRSFTFAYKGEVLALDLDGLKDMGAKSDEAADFTADADKKDEPAESPADKAAARDAKMRDVAAQLAKEAGYRAVEYRGNGTFFVDYEISGVLTHGFVYPYNLDSQMIFPWVSIELRGKDAVRVKATGFAKQDMSAMGSMGMGAGDSKMPSKIDGTFTLTTDATVVSQNNEEGAQAAGGNTVIKWRVTPTTPDAPTAVLRVRPL